MESTSFTNYVGLINFGNTCFLNASIQLLMCAPVLGEFMEFCDKYLNLSDITKYTQTWKDYMDLETKIMGPKIIYYRYMLLNKSYIGFSQEDSHEFLTFTLDDIIEQIKLALSSSQIEQSKKNDIMKEVFNIFRLEFTQTVHYTNPTHPEFSKPSVSQIYENILTLSIESSCKTLDDCVELYMNQTESDFRLTYKLTNPPKYIFVGLKRFKCSNIHIEKIVDSIDIPFQTNIFDPNLTYALKGFIMHVGGIHGGHYYSYGLRKINGEVKWICFNDSNVHEVTDSHVKTEVTQAYILLYARI